MPPLSAYTSFESLLFFQSLASYESRPSSFASISDLLRNNPFVRQNVAFNADRLSPEALEDLYTILMQDGLETIAPPMSPTGPNGHSAAGPSAAATNPKKRKISSPRPDGLTDGAPRHARMVPELVAHLYARYKELVTTEIRLEEKRYREIRDDVERLQKEAHEVPSQVPQEAKPVPEPEPMDVDVKTEKPAQQPVMEVSKHPVEPSLAHRADQPHLAPEPEQLTPQQVLSQATPVQESPPVQRPPVPQPQQGEPPPPAHTLQQQPPQSTQPIPHMQTGHPPQPPPQINGKPPVSSQQPALAPRNAQGPPNAHPVPHVPPPAVPAGNAGSPRAPVVPTSQQPPNGSNAPPAPSVPTPQKTSQEISAKAPSQPQPSFQQWPLNPPAPPQTPHPPLSPYGNPQFPNKAATGKPPFPSPLPQQALKTETGKPYQGHFSPAIPATPGPRPQVQSPAPGPIGGGYETPVSVAQNLSFSELRGSRPHRPSIDTTGSLTPWKRSPRLSIPQSPGSPNRPRPEDVSPISERATSPFEPPEPAPSQRRKGRPTEDKTQKAGREKATVSARKKRDESTPSSRSRGRSVLSPADSTSKIKHEMPSTPAGVPDVVEPEPRSAAGRKGDERPGRGRPKRKRGASEVIEPENFQAETNRQDPSTQSGQYVLSARNFPRTGAPIMNDVTMHKHASIFTKPLTERDAPGYRDLIYRPQDLKSIKSLINQGSKAVTAATEAASTPVTDGESPAPGTPSKNAVLMLPKTEDVIPPKAVVNSAQLEKELIRMFANAIMFNPIPQRGFGPAFPMTSDSDSRESTQVPEADEGGIIKDTLEMFEDVEQAVTRWRAAERTADELASKSVLSLRRGSASEFNTDGADDVKGS